MSSGRYVVALSGGVDSAVVAKAASIASSMDHNLHVFLATGESPSLARQELRDAQALADRIELPHANIETGETANRDYQLNDARRCYHCKTHLFEALKRQYPEATLVTGTNADDLSDYRPGLQAAREHQVRAPLAELGFGKVIIRALARYWELPIAEKPASPCLASRLAYGVEVTSERLAMIEQAEQWLREQGLVEFRVRLHAGELARIELPVEEITRFATNPLRSAMLTHFKSLNFRFVTIDIGGFASGSLNQLIQIIH
jgi:pyridinium-3,5-biscarboxylic acid mononucleotide sulfurtransferase